MQLHRRVIEVEFTSYFKPAIYQSVAACTVNPFAGDCPKGTAAAQRNAEAETHHPNETVCLDSHPQASKLLNALRCEDSYTRNEKHSMKYGSINWSSEISAVCNCSIFFQQKDRHISSYFGSAQNHNHHPWEWRVVPCTLTPVYWMKPITSCFTMFHPVAFNLLFDASGCAWSVWVPLAPNS